jgi:hypothetical protein
MKNILIGTILSILSIGRFLFTEKYFEGTIVICFISVFFVFLGAAQITREFKNNK